MLVNGNRFSPEDKEKIGEIFFVVWKIDGKWKRKYFTDKQKADNYLRLLKINSIEEEIERY